MHQNIIISDNKTSNSDTVLQTVPKKTQRVRDPVHGVITFSGSNKLDQLAWRLIDTPEFQRLRRIKQLGVSEFVYPGATHTRFAHSIGVFHVARQLLEVIRREFNSAGKDIDKDRAKVAVLAALLHDVGHGPFSHTFESVQKARLAALERNSSPQKLSPEDTQKAKSYSKKHEKWSSDIILEENGQIQKILEGYEQGLAQRVSDLLVLENPTDIYHAIVSSSFDADRLDYLRRDRLMTGTGAGAIDFDWLMEHVRVRSIDLDAVDGGPEGDGEKVQTFCIDRKALPAAEQFLLARYTLHEQVYFHKTTRCVEHMIAALLKRISELSCDKKVKVLTGLDKNHPIIQFFSNDTPSVTEYLALDDFVIFGAIERLILAQDDKISELAKRLRERKLYKTLDCYNRDFESQAVHVKKIDKNFNFDSENIIKDAKATLSIYTQIGGDDEKAHKKLRILEDNGKTPEITKFGGIVTKLDKLILTRYYFKNLEDRERAKNLGVKQ
jgi:uncharacterized protein